MKINNMLGYKIFKEDKDKLTIYRITKIKQYHDGSEPSSITVKDLDTNKEKIVKLEELKDFVPLEPDAYLTFNQVHIHDQNEVINDVVITASKILNLKVGDVTPYAICRQSCTDIFYNLICQSEDNMIVGISVNQDTCPTNFQFPNFLACDGVDKSQYVNYYRTDTVEDVLPMIKTHGLNEVMQKNYLKHIKVSGNSAAAFKNEDKGWCKDIETLMKENNFQADVDQMLGIIAVDFNLQDYMIKKPLPGKEGEEYNSLQDDLKLWLSNVVSDIRINNSIINDITVLEYGYDIDLADFKNAKYLLIRDNTKTLYFCVYTTDNDELVADLVNKANEPDISTKYILDFYDKKYKRYNKDNNNQE